MCLWSRFYVYMLAYIFHAGMSYLFDVGMSEMAYLFDTPQSLTHEPLLELLNANNKPIVSEHCLSWLTYVTARHVQYIHIYIELAGM